MHNEVIELSSYRLDRDLTYRELASEMASAGFPVPYRTIHGILTKANPRLHDRTLHKVRQFLSGRKPARKSSRQAVA